MAVPNICSLTVPVNSKALVLRTNSAIFKSFSAGMDLFSQAWRAFLRVFNPATWGMQEYNPITSGVTKMASLDCFWSYLFFYLKSLESLRPTTLHDRFEMINKKSWCFLSGGVTIRNDWSSCYIIQPFRYFRWKVQFSNITCLFVLETIKVLLFLR